jgi:hypothetical protein
MGINKVAHLFSVSLFLIIAIPIFVDFICERLKAWTVLHVSIGFYSYGYREN